MIDQYFNFYKLGDEYYLCIVSYKNIKYLIDTYEDLIEFIDDLPNLYDTIYFKIKIFLSKIFKSPSILSHL